MGAIGPASFQSGARLKAKWFVGDDGARHFSHWFDTQLGISCIFLRTKDGVLRCVPNRFAHIDSSFSDAACTKPAVMTDFADQCAPAYLSINIDKFSLPVVSCNAIDENGAADTDLIQEVDVFQVTGCDVGPFYSNEGPPIGCAQFGNSNVRCRLEPASPALFQAATVQDGP